MKNVQQKKRGGFTLVEVLIVVVILGILAATVMPQFTASNEEAKESAVQQDLALLRSQIQMYKFQHEGRLPAADDLEEKLTSRTDADGTTNNTDGKFGPYLVGQLPPNPYNTLRTVKESTANPIVVGEADGSAGWIYNATTGELKIDWDQQLTNTDGTSQSSFDF